MDYNSVKNEVRQAFSRVHRALGYGFGKEIYEQALRLEFENRNIQHYHRIPVNVYYEGITIGKCIPDFLIYSDIILLVAAENIITDEDTRRLQSYCDTTCCEEGILLNFGKDPEVFFHSRKNEGLNDLHVLVNQYNHSEYVMQI